MKIPQADNVARILDLPLAVANGANMPSSAARRYSFDRRQSLYYFDAAEALGLITHAHGKYALSPSGRRYVALDFPARKKLLVQRMLSLPVMNAIVLELLSNPSHSLLRSEMERIVSSHARFSHITVRRRAKTLLSWFRWLGEETRAFRVDRRSLCLLLREPA